MLCFGASGARGRVPSSAGWDGGGAAGATAARPMYPSCSASLCVCLHHRLVTCSFQPATACDRSGARDCSSHRRGGEAMAAAAYSGSRLQPVLGVCTRCIGSSNPYPTSSSIEAAHSRMQLSGCMRCIGTSGWILPSAGMDDRCDGGEVRPTRHPRVGPPESDRCSVACSFQPATACDRSGARDRSCHRRGGEAMAAAAYPGSRLQPVLGVRGASGAPTRI